MDKITISPNEADQRLDRFLRKYLKNVSLSQIYKMLRKKDVKVNGLKTQENYRLREGDVLEIHIDKNDRNIEHIQEAGMDFSIIYEDNNILIVDKPSELIIHPDIKHKENTLVDQVLYYLYQAEQYNPEIETTFKPAAVNRLDMNTGGIVMFAKNYESLKNMSTMVKERLIEKYYICVVSGFVEGDIDIKAYLTKDTRKNIVKISDEENDESKEIETKIKVLNTSEKYSLLEINLITGRSHQIRAQLAKLNNPIIGDRKYGDYGENKYFKDIFGLSNQFLHAYKVSFCEPTGNLQYLKGSSFITKLPNMYNEIIRKTFNYDMEG